MAIGLRIAHVIDSMEMGGAEMLVAQLCRRQRSAGHDPSVECLFKLGPLGEALIKEGFQVAVHGSSGLRPVPQRLYERAVLSRRLYQRFRSRGIQTVHCHNSSPAVLAAIPARCAGVRSVVLTRHGLVPPPYSWRREMKVSAAARAGRMTTVAVCETARQNLSRAPGADPSRIITIYNGIDRPSETPLAPLPPKRGFVILNVGRLTAEKDQGTLLRAFALACAQTPNLHLWIAGGGTLEPVLREAVRELRLEDRVALLGERMDIGSLLSQADLFVLSSVSEGLPVSLLEAMSASLPVVVTRVGGMPEVVEPSGAGVVVSPAHAEELAKAIVSMSRDPEQCREMGLAGHRHFLDHFTMDHMYRSYLQLYERLAR